MGIYAGKTVLVTGSRGIGEAISKSLFAKGANVIIVSPSESCEKLAATMQSALHAPSISSLLHSRDNKAVAIRSDLSSAPAATELAAKVVKASKDLGGHGKIDYVILCAGIMPMATLDKVDEKTWNHVFAVNVVGPVFLAKELASHIADEGRIIFFSSSLTMASSVTPAYLTYVASKGAIEQTVRALSKDPLFVSRGISVTTLSPGPTATEMFMEGKPDAMLNAIKSANPYGRFGEAEDIASVVESIIGGGKWLNGANIRANGGSFV